MTENAEEEAAARLRECQAPPGSYDESPDCRQVIKTLYDYLDGELTEERRHVIQAHLEGCSPCLEAFDFEAELKAVIARRCREEVPEGLRRRVAQALSQASGNGPTIDQEGG